MKIKRKIRRRKHLDEGLHQSLDVHETMYIPSPNTLLAKTRNQKTTEKRVKMCENSMRKRGSEKVGFPDHILVDF